MKLRYTGAGTVSFLTAGVGEVSPGAEFSVPDEFVASFVHRADIEVVPPTEDKPMPGETPTVSKKKSDAEITPVPLPKLVETAPAVDTETS